MLTGVPARWPRIFSVLGLGGSAAILLVMIAVRGASVFAKHSDDEVSSSELADPLVEFASFLSMLPSTALAAISLLALFVAYLFGEIFILGGFRIRRGSDTESQKHLAKRYAKLAFQNNDLLTTQSMRMIEWAELLEGIGLLALLGGLFSLAISLFECNLLRAVLALATTIGGPLIFWTYAKGILGTVDEMIAAYADLLSSTKATEGYRP